MTCVRAGVRGRHEEPRRQHPPPGEESDELTQVGVDAVERVAAGGPIVELRKVDAIPPALARVLRLAIVNLQKAIERR